MNVRSYYLALSNMSSDRSDGEKENCENEGPNSPTSESGSEQFNHEESRLIVAMENAISQQKAAFCCGGSGSIVAITDDSKEDRFVDVAGLVISPPVILRWDLPSGMYIMR